MADQLPLILAVDDDPGGARADHGQAPAVRARLQGHLRTVHGGRPRDCSRRFATRMRPSRSFSPRAGEQELTGEQLLAEVHELHPHAKRALFIPWGGWADEETADVIRNAMAMGHIDYYAIKPFSSPDEIFHRLVSEFLQEWRRQNAPGRRELRGGESVVPAGRCAQGRTSHATASRTPFTRRTPWEGVQFLAACNQAGSEGARRPVGRGTGLRSWIRRPEDVDAARDARCEPTSSERERFDVVDRRIGAGRPRRGRVRLVRGARSPCCRARQRSPVRPGRAPDAELPRLLTRRSAARS